MRLARVVLAATIGLAPVVAALPARAAECVRVVVDYGTAAGAGMHCTSATGTAAEVLARRAQDLGTTPPRYEGNFLCAIDGYPESGCGDHGTEPYWSFWYWANGGWVYSSLGVDSYTVRDADKDGHPDPLGFRYHAFEKKEQPRANPSYPKPTTAPPPTTQPPATRPPGTSRPAVPTARTSSATSASPPASPGVTGSAPAVPTVTGTPSPGTGGTVTASVPPAYTGPPPREPDGFPVGTVVGGLLALGLLGAAAARFRNGSA